MSNNLFISSNALTTIYSSIIIDEKFVGENNILMIVTNHVDSKFLGHMKDVAKKLGCFNQIIFFNEYSTAKLNKVVSKRDAKTFNFSRFENDVGISDFDNIYTTLYYQQSGLMILRYKNAQVYTIENGTASYFPQTIDKKITDRIKSLYSLNYFGVIKPNFVKQHPNIENIVLDNEKIKEKFALFSSSIKIEKCENCVIFSAQNLSLNPNLMTQKYEFEEYFNVIKFFIDKGYTVYFKDHPKTPNYFYSFLKNTFSSKNFKSIKTEMPLEILSSILEPKAVVGVFSSSLLTIPHLFNIPAYTFKLKNNLRKYPPFAVAYAMVLEYLPDIESFAKEEHVLTNIPYTENPLCLILDIEIKKSFVDRKLFNEIQKNIQSFKYENFGYFDISEILFNIYKSGTYWDLLNYYAEVYVDKIKKAKSVMSNKDYFLSALKIFKRLFF